MRWFAMPLVFALASVACEGGEPAQDAADAGPDSVAIARQAYDAAAFDTVTWENQEAAIERGQVVYRFSCLKCHGEEGLGDAGFIRGGDTLRPPSFLDPEWQYAEDKAGLREQVFVGTAEKMPHWGLVGLGPKDLDAVAIYILEDLRTR